MNENNEVKRVWYNRKMILVIGFVLLAILLYLLVQGIRCHIAVNESHERLVTYSAQTANLSYGKMTYIDKGKDKNETILSVHGIFGGYDQAYDSVESFGDRYRILAPSRFGYLGSDIKGDGSPTEQARAFKELLDKLKIDKVYIVGESAGGTLAIRFALDYPERVKGLILFSSAMPYAEKPEKFPEYAGPPSFLVNNYAMFLLTPFFEPVMGMAPSTIYSMLPINDRKEGVALDAAVNNPDMARNFDDYPIESLKVPTLIIAAKDDKLIDFGQTEQAAKRFPDSTSIFFETGGHLMVGHSEEIDSAVERFIDD